MKIIRNLEVLMLVFMLMWSPKSIMAQPHPNGGAAPSASNGNTTVGGGASLGGGLIFLLAMGAAYGTRKFYLKRRAEYKADDSL
jgi:hypothetical protein